MTVAPAAPSDATRELAETLRFAEATAVRAGAILLERYERVERVDHKSAKDVVTEVDHLSEELILGAIRERYPDDGILAEESGEHRAVGGQAPTLAHGRTWVVDPLDGTVNYANGLPFFCVSMGLLIDGRPAVGVIHDPMRRETFTATSAGPARLGRRDVVVSDKERLEDLVLSLSLSGRGVATRVRATRKAIRVSRNMGSAALALAYVANGRFDAFVQTGGLSAWDIAAAGLIAERGGATVTDMTGGPWFDLSRKAKSIGVIAAPPRHHGELLRLSG
jgi:fructose-1,6-bisphosphatase/inositol monophosphatase family enzyme